MHPSQKPDRVIPRAAPEAQTNCWPRPSSYRGRNPKASARCRIRPCPRRAAGRDGGRHRLHCKERSARPNSPPNDRPRAAACRHSPIALISERFGAMVQPLSFRKNVSVRSVPHTFRPAAVLPPSYGTIWSAVPFIISNGIGFDRVAILTSVVRHGRQKNADRREQFWCVARHAQSHDAAVRDAAQINAVWICNPAMDEIGDQLLDEGAVGAVRETAGAVAEARRKDVPFAAKPVGQNSNEMLALAKLLKSHTPRFSRAAAFSVQEDERGKRSGRLRARQNIRPLLPSNLHAELTSAFSNRVYTRDEVPSGEYGNAQKADNKPPSRHQMSPKNRRKTLTVFAWTILP